MPKQLVTGDPAVGGEAKAHLAHGKFRMIIKLNIHHIFSLWQETSRNSERDRNRELSE